MAVRVEMLTAGQISRAPQWVRRWVDWSLDCTPVDHDRVEDGIRRLYSRAGEQLPGRIEWILSPRPGEVEAEQIGSRSIGTRGWRGPGPPGGIGEISRALNQHVDRDAYSQVLRHVQLPVGRETAVVWAAAHAFAGAEVRTADPLRPSRATPWHNAGQASADLLAALSFLREVCGLDLDWSEFDALRDASAAGRWWPYPDRVVVTERAQVLSTEPCDNPPRAGLRHTRRLHSDDGPAVRWRGAAPAYALHGVQVPGDLVTRGWRPGRILREPNGEVRRLAIERIGWDAFVSGAGLLRVHPPVPDPGNPGRTLTLYDARGSGLDPPARLLLCHNASPERDGTVRRYGLWVPATIDDAVAAAAWTFDIDAATYSRMARAT